MKNIQRRPSLLMQSGFTLLEILIVLAIIGTIMGIVATQVMGKSEQANIKLASQGVINLQGAITTYKLDTKKLPGSLQDLMVKPSGVKHWQGPYTSESSLNDPWDSPYQYRNPGEHGRYDIFSFGADGKAGGSGVNADIGNWDL